MPAPTADPESDVALLERCGWHACRTAIDGPAFAYGSRRYCWTRQERWPVVANVNNEGWKGFRSAAGGFEPRSPTLLQAACAALEIELRESRIGSTPTHDAYHGGAWLAGNLGREQCARRALEAYHAKHGGSP